MIPRPRSGHVPDADNCSIFTYMLARNLLITCVLIVVSNVLIAQTTTAYILRELNDYASCEQRGDIRAEGDSIDGKPHGAWTYSLVSDDNYKYYEGSFDHGRRVGSWNNFFILPPEGYVTNHGLVRSSELWRDGKMHMFKGGKNNIVLASSTGLEEDEAKEIRRLDEAVEVLFRKTYGETVTYVRGESLESLQTYMLERLKNLMIDSGTEGYIKYWNLNKQLEFQEDYIDGVIVGATYYEYLDEKCLSKSTYENDILQEKYVYIMGEPSDIDIYLYYPAGGLRQIKSYRGDSIRAGRWMSYYENGKKKCIGSYSGGKKHGKWTHWDSTGAKTTLKYDEGELLEGK